MRIVFADDRLARICTDEAHKMGLPVAVIKGARRKLLLLEQMPDERSMRNWKALEYKQLSGDREGQRQIRINKQYRIIFYLLNDERPPTIKVIEIGDIH